MKKNKGFSFIIIVAIVLFGISCGNDNEEVYDLPPWPVKEEIPHLGLKASKFSVSPYENFTLSIYQEGINGIIGFDSIKWIIPTVKESFEEGLLSTGLCLSTPGNYVIRVEGYRDGQIISGASTRVHVSFDTDFLGVKWGDTNTDFSPFYNRMENYKLELKYVQAENPYALLEYSFIGIGMTTEEFAKKHASSRFILKDYIEYIYEGEAFLYMNEDITQTPLIDEYNLRFKTSLDKIKDGFQFVPLAIWDAPNAHISVIGSYPTDKECSYYKVIAEPRKF